MSSLKGREEKKREGGKGGWKKRKSVWKVREGGGKKEARKTGQEEKKLEANGP